MKNAIVITIVLFCANLLNAQRSAPMRTNTGGVSASALKVMVWSEWIKNSGNPALEARHAELTAGTITLELRNTGSGTMEGYFTANECPDNKKDVSGWQKATIEPGASIKLNFPTGGCNAGFHWWCKDLYVWSNWFNLNPADYVSARWIKRGNDLAVELVNHKNQTVNADFVANFCDETRKMQNGWKHAVLRTNETVTLKYLDGSVNNHCDSGFHLWYRNLRGPQIIDEGTDLNPVGN